MIYQDEYDTLTEAPPEPRQYIDGYEAPSGQPDSVEPEEELGYIRQSHLRDIDGSRLKNVNGYLQCGKLHKNLFYASGKYFDFALYCGNTRMCDRCQRRMIDKKTGDMTKYGDSVPLFKHEIAPDEWGSWKKWYGRHKSQGDRYWTFPTKHESVIVVSTLRRHKDIPKLENLEDQVEGWIKDDRHKTKRVSSSTVLKECRNSSCGILYASNKSECPECGTPFSNDRTDDDSLLADVNMRDADIQRLFRASLQENGVIINKGTWSVSDQVLNGRTLEQYISEIIRKSSVEENSPANPKL